MSRRITPLIVLTLLVGFTHASALTRPTAAAAASSYEAPVHRHTISWSPEWDQTALTSDITSDRLTLSNGVSTATFRATFGFGGDADACSFALGDDFFAMSPYELLQSYPPMPLSVPLHGDTSAVAPDMYVVRTSTVGEDLIAYVDCRSLGTESVLISFALVPLDAWEGQLAALRSLWRDVKLPPPALPGKVGGTGVTPLTAATVWFAADVNAFWTGAFEDLSETFRVPSYTVVEGTRGSGCGEVWPGVVAFYCPLNAGIYMDDRWLSTYILPEYGVAGIAAILAHEAGHAVQLQLGEISFSRRGELQADCLAGAYMATTVERGIFDQATIDGLANLFGDFGDNAVPSFWDTDAFDESHGTSQQRSTLFQRGYLSGVAACGLGLE
ncbi:MAG: neutral zinc metallopeptidase [Chloroflexota bacterium]|nr:neutral zinc metallopeptidase [Chloroflexota bacterium]